MLPNGWIVNIHRFSKNFNRLPKLAGQVRNSPPVAFTTAATMAADALSISSSVRVRSRG
jgi:hypothetical protein